jgi:predicted nucleic acid-binding protein
VTLIVDASVAVKWYVTEPGSDVAQLLLEGQDLLFVPAHALPEIGQVLTRRLTDGRLTREQVDAAFQGLRQTLAPISLGELTPVALEIALAAEMSFYDALYVAAAVTSDTEVVTADRDMIRLLARTPWASRAVDLRTFVSRKGSP